MSRQGGEGLALWGGAGCDQDGRPGQDRVGTGRVEGGGAGATPIAADSLGEVLGRQDVRVGGLERDEQLLLHDHVLRARVLLRHACSQSEKSSVSQSEENLVNQCSQPI